MYWLNCYILFIVNWIDVELIELLVDVENLVNWNWMLIMWINIEKWWNESDCDELLWNWMICWQLIDLLMLWELCEGGMWWDEKWDVEMLIMKEWIELLRLWIWDFDELDWIVELCELHVFDGNKLIV